ncbi:MAG: hypothetical protein ACI8XU_001676 [Kiritimatiellia bacterium]|jgi:hypothetical protein
MQIYKDTLALEACPAKTAETVSYGATFAVLGWLLLSNYSGFGYAEQPIVSSTSPSGNSITPTEYLVNKAAADIEVEDFNETPFSAAILIQAETESSNFVTTPPSWHADLDPYQQYEGQTHQRAFSTVGWNDHTSGAGQQIAGFLEELVLPLPLIDTAYLFDAKGFSEMASNGDLASNTLGETELVREITVKGAKADRLTNRPGNIHRPQIPRPYRAQEIQRSFVLPPRIQALRP